MSSLTLADDIEAIRTALAEAQRAMRDGDRALGLSRIAYAQGRAARISDAMTFESRVRKDCEEGARGTATCTVLIEGEHLAELPEACGLDGGAPFGLLVAFVPSTAHGDLIRDALASDGDGPMAVYDVPGGGLFVVRRAR